MSIVLHTLGITKESEEIQKAAEKTLGRLTAALKGVLGEHLCGIAEAIP